MLQVSTSCVKRQGEIVKTEVHFPSQSKENASTPELFQLPHQMKRY